MLAHRVYPNARRGSCCARVLCLVSPFVVSPGRVVQFFRPVEQAKELIPLRLVPVCMCTGWIVSPFCFCDSVILPSLHALQVAASLVDFTEVQQVAQVAAEKVVDGCAVSGSCGARALSPALLWSSHWDGCPLLISFEGRCV